MKRWNIGKLRPLTVLVGLHAEDWKERITRRHMSLLPEDLSGHPQKVIEAIYSLVLSVNHEHQDMSWVAIVHRMEAIYALNNCIMAYALGPDRVTPELGGPLGVPELQLDPEKIIVYQCDSDTEKPVCISDPKTGWIDERPLGKYGDQLCTEMNQIGVTVLMRKEAREKAAKIKDTSKKPPRIKNTGKKPPRVDPDQVAKALGAKKSKPSNKYPRRCP